MVTDATGRVGGLFLSLSFAVAWLLQRTVLVLQRTVLVLQRTVLMLL